MWGGGRNEYELMLEEADITSTSLFDEDVDPKKVDLTMKITERIFIKMKEDEVMKKAWRRRILQGSRT
jgi:hypothetical protein